MLKPQKRKSNVRPPPIGALVDLIELRKQKYPGMAMQTFARDYLQVTRMHMASVEKGRRQPSLELVIRWLAALGPGAHLSMFGNTEVVKQICTLKQVTPKGFQNVA